MPVVSGVSVGDFVAVITLSKNVAVALKNQGGASNAYRKTFTSLERKSAILSCVGIVDDRTVNSAISTQFEAFLRVISQILRAS